MSGRHNEVSIIGLGNILDGDLGVACQILETLSLVPFEVSANIMYAGGDPLMPEGLYEYLLKKRLANNPRWGWRTSP